MSGFDIRVHFLSGIDAATRDRLDAIDHQLREINMGIEEIRAANARINAAITNIAADIQRLKDRIATGMTPAEVAEVQGEAQRIATLLEGVADDPDNPEPAA